ncbi:MAG: glycosyltransferase family 2 protein [Rhizobiaceae bacterium]|nr:glycosyltransferase family 2 protein [Rhizobiaceae bacterium]
MSNPQIAVVIPCYKVTAHVIGVIAKIGPEVAHIFAVDDCCPDNSGQFIKDNCHDLRVKVIRHAINRGVGGAVMTGYREAINVGAEIIVKIDGDGQMNPALLPAFVRPIVSGEADYTKGNRFFDLDEVAAMPRIRLIANAGLSMMNKLSSGYWNIFDPTNGYTAIHAEIAKSLPLNKIHNRYFFETDMLFRLNSIRAVVVDVPMSAVYGDEVSNLSHRRALWDFGIGHLRNLAKRIGYNYFLRDMSLASIELVLGIALLLFGLTFGTFAWAKSILHDATASAGTVMLAALPIVLGTQLILSFLSYDISNVPTRPKHRFSNAPRVE